MRKHYLPILSIIALGAVGCVTSSCNKDDDEPPVKPKLSFAATTMTVNEADGIIEVEVKLDKEASEDITIEYELDGSAIERSTVAANQAYDYEDLSDNAGELEIQAGETSGIIELQLNSDPFIEDSNTGTDPLDPETIEVKITDVNSEDIEITNDDEIEISIEQEDGMLVLLAWEGPSEDLDSLADMDLLVRAGTSIPNWEVFYTASISDATDEPEAVFIPKAAPYSAFGFSYVYYDGNKDPLPFGVLFAELVNREFEAEDDQEIFEASYEADNKNKWTNANTTVVVQTFEIDGGSFTTPSEITVPTTGSRVRPSVELPTDLNKQSIKSGSTINPKTLLKMFKGI
jgi:hypothetical protein